LSRVRNLTYQIYQNIGQAITDLSNIEGGFDFEVNPVTRALDIYYGTVKTGSTIFGRGVNRPEVVFGYRWGPSNLSNASRTTDGSKLMNQETATGRYGTGQQTDTASVATYGLYEEQQTLSEVVDVNVLDAEWSAEDSPTFHGL